MIRSTREVFEHHLRLRLEGRTEEDIDENYADSVILLSPLETAQGKQALRRWADDLSRELPDAKFEFGAQQVNGSMRFFSGALTRSEPESNMVRIALSFATE